MDNAGNVRSMYVVSRLGIGDAGQLPTGDHISYLTSYPGIYTVKPWGCVW